MQVDCGNNRRKVKRDIQLRLSNTVNGTDVSRDKFGSEQMAKIEELPLEFVMVVRNPKASSDRFIFGENKILIAGYGQ